MIVSVLERRSEIGLRRALGATKNQIRTQFLAESILLAVIAAWPAYSPEEWQPPSTPARKAGPSSPRMPPTVLLRTV
jgi:hypothetical protein